MIQKGLWHLLDWVHWHGFEGTKEVGQFSFNNQIMATWVFDIWRNALYTNNVIKSFKDELTRNIYQRQTSRKLPPNIQQVALRKLRMINNAISLSDLRIPPANRLEKLSGDRSGQWSIRVNDQWRICFEWRESDAYNVEFVDYH